MAYEQVGDGARPPWWRSLVLVLLVGFASLLSVSVSPLGHQVQTATTGAVGLMAGVAMLLAVCLPMGLFWRHRFPFTVTLVAAVVALFVPLGNALAFVALASLLGRRRGPAVWVTVAVVALTSTWVVVADALAQPRGASLIKTTLGPLEQSPDEPMAIGVGPVVVVAVVVLGLTVGAGLLVRWRREVRQGVSAVESERAVSGRLGDEVARRQERERIAREVHDAMGHRLSLLNLHAGALELNAGDDPRLRESAHLVRASAGAAMDDLRGLLDVLREPGSEEASAIPLSRLPEVVRDSFGAGQQVNSSIFIAEADRADPALSRAVYRIVQELLTNARKHAPGASVLLTVEGGPAAGVVIEARNAYAGAERAGEPGSARGLAGITERAELLGGRVQFGLDEAGAVFRVRVELPWREAGAV